MNDKKRLTLILVLLMKPNTHLVTVVLCLISSGNPRGSVQLKLLSLEPDTAAGSSGQITGLVCQKFLMLLETVLLFKLSDRILHCCFLLCWFKTESVMS